MSSTTMRWPETAREWVGRIDFAAVATWLLGFGLVAYLGMEGGGYDPLVHDQVGIAVWWILIAGVLARALPRRRPGALGLAALGTLAAFVAWTALGLSWTESSENTLADLARIGGYLGVFALALSAAGAGGARRLVAGAAAGIVLVGFVALLSRLDPAAFPEAGQVAVFLSTGRERLSYPVDYWNGLGALLAIGLPLLLYLATCARSVLGRAAAAAALPALGLACFLTLSRSGIAAACIAAALFLLLASDRIPKLSTAVVAAVGGVVLVLAADARQAFQDGLVNSAAESQGDEMAVIVLVVCLTVGAIQAAISGRAGVALRPGWLHVSRRDSFVAAGTVAVVALIAMAVLDVPGRAADAWEEFKQPESPGEGAGRLGSAAGQSRYQYWSVAVDENGSRPLTGTGSGTFEYWWARDGDNDDTVRDAHSLYLQTLGELGIVGLLLLVAFILVVIAGGARETLRAPPGERPLPAAALAGCVAFFLTVAFDWMWQLPVLPVAMLLLASVLLTPRPDADGGPSVGLAWPLRVGVGVFALAAIVVIAIPLASTGLVRQSEADARAGDLPGALEAARTAQNVEPAAATPRLQQALVLEQMGDLGSAAAAARAATERESTNWRPWLVLARIEARRGRAAAAVADYREARSLNPRSPIFDR